MLSVMKIEDEDSLVGLATTAVATQSQPLDDPGHAAAGAAETRTAIINSVKLSLSLVGTLIVAFSVRFMIPRYVGPAAFGQLNFADAFAMGFFVFATFGVDSYIRKEVSRRLEHVNDFWAGFWLLRLAASAVIFALMAFILSRSNKGPLEWRLVFIFGLGQVAFVHNFTVTSLLHAASEVNELAYMNVFSKLLWGCGIASALVIGWHPLEMVAVAFLLSEVLKAVYLSRVTQRKLGLIWRVDMTATWAMLAASFPYYLNYLGHRTYEQLNVSIISFMTTDEEAGWYGAAKNIATISLLFLPIFQAVVVPMASRTAAKSTEALNELMRGAVRLTVVAATFFSIIIALEAETLVAHAFGPGFAESAISLRMLAPMFPLTYLATLGAQHLIQLDRIWTMVMVSLAALIANFGLNVGFIHLGHGMAPGWAGGMSSLASICTEGANALITFLVLGTAAVDRRLFVTLGKTAGICLAVAGVHYLLKDTLGLWSVPVEALAYWGFAVLTGALPAQEIRRMVTDAVSSRRRARKS